jgi:hypothetical protein
MKINKKRSRERKRAKEKEKSIAEKPHKKKSRTLPTSPIIKASKELNENGCVAWEDPLPPFDSIRTEWQLLTFIEEAYDKIGSKVEDMLEAR